MRGVLYFALFVALVVPPLVFVATSTKTTEALHPAPAPLDENASAIDSATLAKHARDVVDYTWRASLDPIAHTVHGEGTIVWRNTSARAIGEIWLHLYLNAFKNVRSAFLRERVGGRGSAPPDDWGWIDVRRLTLRDSDGPSVDLWPAADLHRPGDEDETDARVPLPRAVAPGEQLVLDVVFDDKLPAIVERTGYRGRFHMVAQWFPKIARLEPDGRWAHFAFHHLSEFYADFGTYDVTIDTPEDFVVGATGPIAEERIIDRRRLERHVQSDVHDFAWTAWDAFQVVRDSVDGVAVTLLHPPGYARIARRELEALHFALPYFSARYGRYPYRVLTLMHPPRDAAEAGGMEYPTLITGDGPWWTPPGVAIPEAVAIHELGHQWFYGLVATDELSWPVLDEGINQFAEVDALAKWRGAGSLADVAGLVLSDAAVQAVGGNMGVHDEPVAQAADSFSSGANYQRLVYARTASVMETLARVYGDDAVARALGLYARRYRFEHPGPADLFAAFEEAMGSRVTATLRDALYGEGWVDYAVDGAWTQEARRPAGVFDRDGKRDKVESAAPRRDGSWDSSVLVRRRGTLALPVELELTFADGSTRREPWDGQGRWKRFSWRGPSALRGAAVDPDDRVLVDANLANNAGSCDSSVAWAPRTLERVTYVMQLLLQAVSP